MREAANIAELALLPIDYMGFIFYDKTPRYIATLPNVTIPPHIKKTGVFVDADKAFIDDSVKQGLQAVQLHGQESPELCQQLKEENLEVIKAIGVTQDMNWETLEPYTEAVDYFLFDTSSPRHGGTGRSFNWDLLENYPYQIPYFLSGGLDLNNIPTALAITDERLAGLDINSKFEIKPGLKDISKLKKALEIIR